jgi:hypothetical protein
MEHNIQTDVGFGGSVAASGGLGLHGRAPRSLYHFECVKPDGSIRWSEKIGNVVTLDGRIHLLTNYFKGSSYTASWYVGIIKSTQSPNSTDYMASTTRDWAESTAYSDGARRTLTLGSVSTASVDNSTTKASFTINQTTEIFGAFVTNSSQISTGSTYILYGAAVFNNPSSSGRSVVSGDTLNVTVTLTASTS